MKRIVLSFILFLIFFVSLNSNVLAKTATPTPDASASPSAQKVEYVLPYPGILPDNILYPLKMLRDRILDLFIRDPIKKTEFLILMADKRLGAGQTLINTDIRKIELGISTISKGENYLSRAVDQVSKLREQGGNVADISEKLENSLAKHIEVLQEIKLKVPASAQPGITNALENAKKGYQRVLEIKTAR